jgi:hypothetical protein
MIEHALQLAKERGWHVFPCCAWDKPSNAPENRRGKAPLTHNGLKAATTEEGRIRRWWSQWPDANIGVACGASGIVAIDVDGAAGWEQLEYGGYDLPETLTQITGKDRGKHAIYAAGGHGLRNQGGMFGEPGVDIRGDGGYIIVAPSRHYSGKLYEFEDPDMPIAEVPMWLVGYQQTRTGDLDEARKALKTGATIPDHHRNIMLHRIGCVYRRDNQIQDEELMYALLAAENKRRCVPPMEPDEVRRIARQAVKVLPDEIELPGDGWGDTIVNIAKQTGDAATVKKAEALRVEIGDKLPEAPKGALTVNLIRYVSPDIAGGVFSAVVNYMGHDATISSLTGEDLNSADRIKAKCLAEKLVIPAIKRKAWDSLLKTAMAQCLDVEVPRESSVTGACIEVIMEMVEGLANTSDWSDFPAGKDRYKFDHGDGSYSVHARALRSTVERAVRDAKRKDINAALDAISAVPHRTPNGGIRMQRITVASDANTGVKP